jgi:hypothetical protein
MVQTDGGEPAHDRRERLRRRRQVEEGVAGGGIVAVQFVEERRQSLVRARLVVAAGHVAHPLGACAGERLP